MRSFITCLAFSLVSSLSVGQDPGMQAAQMASQTATQISVQASQQATQDMLLASQNATNAAQQAAQSSLWNSYYGSPVTLKFSIKAGAYDAPVSVSIRAPRGATVYYTTDGWTPTLESTRYTVPINIDSTTTLQAIAITPSGAHSRVFSAFYTVKASSSPVAAVPPLPSGVISNAAAAATASGKLLLAKGTAVPLVFTSDVSSKAAHVGDKLSLSVAQDLIVNGVVLVKKGTDSVVTVTAVQKSRAGGLPGAIFFKAESLQVDGTVIKLHGSAAKQGQDQQEDAAFIPLGPIFIHGGDAQIRQGAVFTAFVDSDTELPAQ